MGRSRLKSSIQTKGKRVDFISCFFFFSGQVLSQWCDCPAFSVLDIRIYVQFCVFILSFFFFNKKEKKDVIKEKKKRRNYCFPQPRLTFDCLFYCV